MDKICSWLFGEEKWMQEAKLKKLLLWSAGILVVGGIQSITWPPFTPIMLGVLFLMWGWRIVQATTGVGRITEIFQNDAIVVFLILFGWLLFGCFAGAVCCLLGIIRYIQIKREGY